MSYRTYTGAPKTGSITGFSTIEIQPNHEDVSSPAPVVTPAQILDQISKLQADLKLDLISKAIEALKLHASDTNNPHKTSLYDFSEQIIDVLYRGYIEAGGTGSYDHFKQCLFSVMRIATQAEMLTSKDPNLLISVLGARQFIDNHETDTSAHEAMIRYMFPGQEIYDDPAYALYAEYGVSKKLCIPATNILEEEDVVFYSYIGPDFKLHYCTDRRELPRDYSYGRPLIPCFGIRTNSISNSTDFMSLKRNNVTVIPNTQESPDGSNTATGISLLKEEEPKDHTLSIPNVLVPIDTQKVFSVFVKGESCHHFQISFMDMYNTRIRVRAIFDLLHQRCLLMNHMDRYKAEIIPLNNGWSRCVFIMSHPIGQEADLDMTFFKGSIDDEDTKFQAENEICGYLWGMQMEEGPSVSPYMPTEGNPVTRYPLPIRIDLEDLIGDPSTVSWSLATSNPKTSNCGFPRPLFTVKDGDDIALTAHVDTDGTINILHHTRLQVEDMVHMAAVHQDVFPLQDSAYLKIAYGTSPDTVVSAVNDFARQADLSSAATFGNTLLLGTDGSRYLEGYLDHFILYGSSITKEQAVFLNGDLL